MEAEQTFEYLLIPVSDNHSLYQMFEIFLYNIHKFAELHRWEFIQK